MITTRLGVGVLCVAPVLLLQVLVACATTNDQPGVTGDRKQTAPESLGANEPEEKTLNVHYLEIVTPSVDATCAALQSAHGVTFGAPIAALGNARTAKLDDGGWFGVRAPMRPTEAPVVRPYVLVNDIEAAVRSAEAAGAEIALPPMELPGHGRCAIYFLGGIEHGLWQL